MKSEQIKEITDRATEQLIAALQAGHSETLTAYLKVHRYSLHNVLLIASQKPNASYVAGFRTWNELGRFVRKGEKGILILAPILRRKSDGDDETEERTTAIAGFRAVRVRCQPDRWSRVAAHRYRLG
jgi:antirestriction protein ArdC